MSNYYHGQRVRLVRARFQENVGLEGRFRMYVHTPAGAICADGEPAGIEGDCIVHYDGDPRPCVEHTSRIEPILPEGAAPSEHTFHQLMDLLTAGEVANV